MKSVMTYGVTMVVVLALTASSQAVLLSNAGGTLFFDDFETASQVEPAVFPGTMDADPDGAAPGVWTVQESPALEIQVTNSTTAPDPGPFQGENYLRVHRTAADTAARGDFTQQSGGALHLEFMAYIPSSVADSAMKVVITDGPDVHGWTDHRAAFMTRYDATWGYYLRYWGGSWIPVQGADGQGYNGAVTFTPDVWQKWEVVVDLDTQMWHLSVGDQTSFDRAFGNAGTTAKAVCFVPAGGNKVFYVDAVPEPATMALLALGGINLLRRRK